MKLGDVLGVIGNEYPVIESKEFAKTESRLTASFVIPAYNSANFIDIVLGAINNQCLKQNIAEVIVIDDAAF